MNSFKFLTFPVNSFKRNRVTWYLLYSPYKYTKPKTKICQQIEFSFAKIFLSAVDPMVKGFQKWRAEQWSNFYAIEERDRQVGLEMS